MNTLEQLLIECGEFPLAKRIAAAYALTGGTIESFSTDAPRELFDDALLNHVENYLRDFKSGFSTISPRLKELAEELHLTRETANG